MVRAPCCEKMGLIKGPWTPEEDKILVAYIQKHGHGNWRALPKQAGLLRCGKSCRLRWTNYLRPDIKRGNFTEEEEDTIISLHQMLGNRWSAIAARLPGRTDNEIKNVWHTHLKKRVKNHQNNQESANKSQRGKSKSSKFNMEFNHATAASPARSCSDLSCCGNESSIESGDNSNETAKEGLIESSDQGFQQIDDSFWMEALSMEGPVSGSSDDSYFTSDCARCEDDLNFWLRIFMQAGDSQGLPEI